MGHAAQLEAVPAHPLRRRLQGRLGAVLRTTEPLERRLRRVHHRLDPGAFRFRQVSHAVVGLGLAGALAAALRLEVPPLLVVTFVLAISMT